MRGGLYVQHLACQGVNFSEVLACKQEGARTVVVGGMVTEDLDIEDSNGFIEEST